jgi:hypothetical protein
MWAALAIIVILERYGIPWVLEHPINSLFFHSAACLALLDRHHVHYRVVDQCHAGARWRKRTKLLFSRCDELDTSWFDRRCSGPRSLCSRTLKPHIVLEGSKTAASSRYPRLLARKIANILVEPLVFERLKFMKKGYAAALPPTPGNNDLGLGL